MGQSGASSAAVAAVESAAKKREEKLKARIQELVNALETLSKHCETKDRQSSEYMADLKRANRWDNFFVSVPSNPTAIKRKQIYLFNLCLSLEGAYYLHPHSIK